jgi:hypothetical protein
MYLDLAFIAFVKASGERQGNEEHWSVAAKVALSGKICKSALLTIWRTYESSFLHFLWDFLWKIWIAIFQAETPCCCARDV